MINKKAFRVAVMSTAFLLVAVCLSYSGIDHSEYKKSSLEECRDCHRGAGVASNHGAFFVKEHRLLAQKAGNNCADCHQQSFCLDCHKGGNIEPDLRKSLSRTGEPMPTTAATWTPRANRAEDYERYLVPAYFGPFAEALVALAAPWPGEQVLDVEEGAHVTLP